MATLVSGSNVLDFSVCQSSDCQSFSFNETSGVYSLSNSGGWGGSNNFDIADAVEARIIVTLPNGTIAPTLTLPTTFPDSTGLVIKTITAGDLGLTGGLPDGIYNIEYQVDISNVNSNIVSFSARKSTFFSCTVKCCIDKLISKIAASECDCDDVALKNATLAHGLYLSLLYNAGCGNTTEVATLLTRLTKLCSIQNCGCS